MKKNGKRITTLVLFIILVVLIIVYFAIPNSRTKIKKISKEEYIDSLYNQMLESKEQRENIEIEDNVEQEKEEEDADEDLNNDDELLKLNN